MSAPEGPAGAAGAAAQRSGRLFGTEAAAPGEAAERPVAVPSAGRRDEGEADLPGPAPLAWGVVGATSAHARRAVVPAMLASPKCRLVAVASASAALGSYEDFGARALPSYEDVLADPEVEAVYVPLPNDAHAGWVARAAEAGKHVLCEKPLARTAEEAAGAAAAAQAAGVVLMEAYMTPFHPRSVAVADLVRSGRLGEARFASASFTFPLPAGPDYRWSPEKGGGALLDLGVYVVSPLLLAAGGRAPADVRARAVRAPSGVDASCAAWLDFGDGFAASFECSYDAPRGQRLEVVGTEATLTVERPFTPGPRDVRLTLASRDGRTREVEAGGGDPYRNMLDHVQTVVRGGDRLRHPPSASVEWLGVLDRVRAAAGLAP